jgi:SAM-dependent methyltransferase
MEPATLSFSWTDAAAYQAFMGRWSERLAPHLLRVSGLAPGSRVLDVACGTGVLSLALAEAGAQVTGIDASADYLAGARAHPGITYEPGDVRRMRFADGAFDAALCSLALDVIPEAARVVAEMRRVTRPGGVIASALHAFFGGMPAFDLVLRAGAARDAGFARFAAARAVRPHLWPGAQAALWRQAGLREVTETPVVIDCDYPGFADFWASFTNGQGSISGELMALPEPVRAAIEQDVRDGFLAGLPDGPRCFPMVFRIVRGLVPG